MQYLVCAVSKKTGNPVDMGDNPHNNLNDAVEEYERLNSSIDMSKAGFRWVVFSMSEIDVANLPSKHMKTPLYSIGDEIKVRDTMAEIVSITVTPEGVNYLVELHPGEVQFIDQKNIEDSSS